MAGDGEAFTTIANLSDPVSSEVSENTASVFPYEPAGRYLLEISFEGTNYSGWQFQHHCLTVQEAVQNLLSKLYAGLPITLTGSSRTDAGVHALGLAASFAFPERPSIPIFKLKKAMNRLLPSDIRIQTIQEVPLTFNPRFDAQGKAYTYVLNVGDETPFSSRFSWHMRQPLNVENMREAAAHLIGTHDFSSFVVERFRIDDAVRTIYRIEFNQFGHYLCISFIGNGFLYKMIRCLTGLLEAVGSGQLTPADAKRILTAKDRTTAPETAPPHGLYLMKVFYQQELMPDWHLTNVPFFL